MGWLFERPSTDIANHWLALLGLVLFAVGVIAAGIISTRPNLPPFSGRYTQKFVMLCCTVVGWISGVGLFFGIIRLFQIDPATLGRPFWIVLCWIALIAAVAWLYTKAPADRDLRKINTDRLARRQSQKSGRKTAS